MAKYMYQGKQISKTEALKKPFMAVGLSDLEPQTAVAFDSRDQLEKYISNRKELDTVRKAFEQIEAVQKMKGTDVSKARERQVATVKRIDEDLRSLAAEHNLPVNSRELFELATSNADPIAGSIFHSCQLFEHPNCTGRVLNVNGFTGFPVLAWHNFNNIASSIRVGAWSMSILFDLEWYNPTGRFVFFFSWLWNPAEYNLDAYIDNRASSVWTT